MYFFVLFGPPAVGKMAVGQALQSQTGIRLFHNHMSIEPVLNFFDFGSAPFARLVNSFRRNLLAEVAQSDLPGLCFTYVWDLDAAGDTRFVKATCELFESAGAKIGLIELACDIDERLRRNRHPDRLAAKPSKRNLERSEQNLLDVQTNHRVNSGGRIDLDYRHIVIDNTFKPPEQVAEIIVEEFCSG